MHEYTGVIHFHSEYSNDGRAPIPAIIEAARENKIDILMLTDHENLDVRSSGQEGWHGNVLLISGEEICPSQFNHYLAFGAREPLSRYFSEETGPQTVIDRVRDEGGIGIIAHPDHEGTELFHVKQYAWKHWPVSGFTGMGIWDFMTDWQSSLSGYAKGMASYFFPAFFLRGPRKETLERWDELNQTARVAGVGELDNHDTPYKFMGKIWSVFPFRKAFRFIRSHFILESPLQHDKDADIASVYEALRNGRIFVSLDYFGQARGFLFTVVQDGRELHLGDDQAFAGKAHARVRTPGPGRIRLLRDGSPVAEVTGESLELELREKGVYRVEVYNRAYGCYRPWIFSNPIYLR
jgi:hypothetical protein